MGIRFRCPNGHKLNVKSFQAGMRGICPYCGAKFTVPAESAQTPHETKDEPTQNGQQETVAHAPLEMTGPPNDNRPPEKSGPPEVRSEPAAARRERKNVADPLGEDPSTVWYVRPPSGGQFGPADANVMRAWFKEGRVTADSLVWREGWRDWVEAVTVFPKLAMVKWSPDDSDSTSKRPPPPPPNDSPNDSPNDLPNDLSKLGQKDTKTTPTSKRIARKRSRGKRRLRSAREVKDRQVKIVAALSVLTVALACLLVWVLMRGG